MTNSTNCGAAVTIRPRFMPPTRPPLAPQGTADGYPGQDHQGLRSRRSGRGKEHLPSAEKARTRKSCSNSALASGFRCPTMRHARRPSTVRPRTALRSYIQEHRAALGGYVPTATCGQAAQEFPDEDFGEFLRVPTDGTSRPRWPSSAFSPNCSGTRRSATHRAHRSGRGSHLRHGFALPAGRHLLPRRPALRTGRPRDAAYYREAKDGQLLEEGITEAGSMSSFIAAGTSYATHGINTIPFFIFYSMFGFQRIGDLIWAAADMRAGLPGRRHRRPHLARRRGPPTPGRQIICSRTRCRT